MNGGIWKTTDGGSTWTPLNLDGLKTLSMGGMATDPGNPSRLYATLENFGIFRSKPGWGASWRFL